VKSVKALAAAVCSFINILDPEAVIIAGELPRGRTLFEPLQQFSIRSRWRPIATGEVVPAQLGEFAGAFGAFQWVERRSADPPRQIQSWECTLPKVRV